LGLNQDLPSRLEQHISNLIKTNAHLKKILIVEETPIKNFGTAI
jgi:hypothetical protein